MKAAAQGHEGARQALLIMAQHPAGADTPLYTSALMDAAQQGNSDAQCMLATLHRSGESGVEQDTRRAKQLFKASAAQGSSEAAASLTSMRACSACGAPRAPYTCQRCKEVKYCNTECQRKHWTEGPEPHKAHCTRKHVAPSAQPAV